MRHESNPAPAAPDLTDAASAAEYIEKLAAEYLQENASNESDTGAVVFHTGEAGRDYHSTLVELAEDLRSHVKPAPAVAAPVPASTGRDSALRVIGAELLKYLDGHGWGGIVEGETANKFRAALAAPVAASELDADAERREFEVHASERGLTLVRAKIGNGYYLSDTNEAWKAWCKVAARQATAESAPASAAPREPKQLAHGHRDDFYLMANARIVAEKPIHAIRSMPNWVFAGQLFATGSNSAWQICLDAGINPDGYKVERAPSNSPVGAKEQDK